MAPRAAVRSLLGTDTELIAMDFSVDNIYSSHALDTPDRDFRWIVVNWIDEPKAFGLVGPCLAEIWLYQPKEMSRDYGVLDSALVRVRELMCTATHVPGADGWTLSEASWQGDSADLFDDSFQALTKFSRYRIAARNVVVP